MNIENLLKTEIESELEILRKEELGTEKYKNAVDGVTKLVDRVIVIEKHNTDFEEGCTNREIDTKLKMKQMVDENKDRFVKNSIATVGIMLPLAVTIWGAFKSWEFEEKGTVTSIMGKGFMNKLLKK